MTDPREKIKEALLPCPFCGSEARMLNEACDVRCQNEDCQASIFISGDTYEETPKLRIAAWNTRASQAATKPAGGDPVYLDLPEDEVKRIKTTLGAMRLQEKRGMWQHWWGKFCEQIEPRLESRTRKENGE